MKPNWVDGSQYPFEPETFLVDGFRMRYLDEGEGKPVVFVHGTPTWSFVWRHLVSDLREDYRTISPDHLGFGLSDKPENADYSVPAHAERLERLIGHLGLRDITLVLHDFGGPIGLSYALRHPENVERLILMNTWMWSNQGNRSVESAGRLLGGPVGKFLYRRLNFSARALLPAAFAQRKTLSREIHRHYLAPFPNPGSRQAPWILARELTGSNDWYDELWRSREGVRPIPKLFIWGMKDKLMPSAHLQRWCEAFPSAGTVRLHEVGHFPQEEAPEEVVAYIRDFLRDNAARKQSA